MIYYPIQNMMNVRDIGLWKGKDQRFILPFRFLRSDRPKSDSEEYASFLKEHQIQDIIDLSNCYLSCLNNAKENNLSSIAFPCISTGIYNFDKEKASLIAYQAVRKWQKENKYNLKIIFCVFNDYDYLIYKKRLKNDN